MKYLLRTLLIVICFATISVQAQNQQSNTLDSLISLYNNGPQDSSKAMIGNLICQDLLYTQPEEAFRYANEIIEHSKKIGFRMGIAKGYHRLGGYYLNRQELDSAEHYHNKSLEINEEMNIVMDIMNDNTQLGVIYMRRNDPDAAYAALNRNVDLYNRRDSIPGAKESDFKFLGSTFHTLATAYREQGLYQLALRNELKALELYEETGEALFIADAYNALGAIEQHLKNYSQAVPYYKKALKTYNEYNDEYFEGEALYNLSFCLQDQKQYKASLEYLFRGLKIAEKNSYKLMEARANNLIGNAYMHLNEIQNAFTYLQRSIKISEAMDHATDIQFSYGNMGLLYSQINDPQKAIPYFDKAIAIADSVKALQSAALFHQKRSEAYLKMNEHEKALQDYVVYNRLNDSVFNTTKSRQIEEMRTIFDTEKKEQEIVLQQREIENLEQKAKISNLQRILFGTGLALSLAIIGFGFYGFRQKIKRSRLEKEKLDAELAFKKKELTTHALHLAKKNEVLENVKQKAEVLRLKENASGYTQLINTIKFDQQDDKSWENFTQYFEQVHKDFASNVRRYYPEVTKNELRFMALVKMNLSSKEIASILNITTDGIKKVRQRLRKKMKLSPDDSLENTVLDI